MSLEGCEGTSLPGGPVVNLYAEYIMRNAMLDEVQAGIKIAGRNIDHPVIQNPLSSRAR